MKRSGVRILVGQKMNDFHAPPDRCAGRPGDGAPVAPGVAGSPLLVIEDLSLEFGGGQAAVRALDGVSICVGAGEAVCLVGESGSGKSATALSIARLLPTPPARYLGGTIRLSGRDVLAMSSRELRRIRGGVVSYVFQEPGASLNPVFRVGTQIREALRLHRPEAASDEEVVRLLRLVGIPAPEVRMRDYAHQLSGGMQQRVMLAMALAPQPKLLVADEPTTALDVTIQAQIIELLIEIRRRFGMSILLITHNLGLVGDLADRVVVMYAGQVVEDGRAGELISRPLHPYTRALLDSVPQLGRRAERLRAVPGTPPPPGVIPPGCRFHPRCPEAREDCRRVVPSLEEHEPGHRARCPYASAAVRPDGV